MGEGLILESSFLIDLEREAVAGVSGPAHDFLEKQERRRLMTTFTVTGEIASGIPPERRAAWERFLARFQVLPWSPEISWHYGQIHRYLRTIGLSIGANDLWIAATALAHEVPLVTGDLRHYSRVPGLSLRPYRAG